MTERMNIQKILSPLLGTSRVNPVKRQNPDSPKKRFQKHFESSEDEEPNEGSTGKDEPTLERETTEKTKRESRRRRPTPIHKDLGKRIDIHV